jgi:hypothetical protein
LKEEEGQTTQLKEEEGQTTQLKEEEGQTTQLFIPSFLYSCVYVIEPFHILNIAEILLGL